MKYFLLILAVAGIIGASLIGYYYYGQDKSFINPISEQAAKITAMPLEKYEIEKLRKVSFEPGEITLGEIVFEDDDIVSRMFYFQDKGASGNEEGLKVSGLMNYPKSEGDYPVVVMFRGFVDREIFTSGEGTRRSGEELARNGFISLAPDFLGYGQSEMPSQEPLEERFQTYTTALSLLASVENLNDALSTDSEISATADIEKLGVFAHSNGGQIALTSVGILGTEIPVVLWAPVTKPFPYNILYFTDEYDDQGKALRALVAEFEKNYDVFDYSILSHLNLIKSPLQIHQGSDDEAVPQRWSDQFVEIAEDDELEVEYLVYPGENHNFGNGSWPLAIEGSIEFFNTKFNEKDGES